MSRKHHIDHFRTTQKAKRSMEPSLDAADLDKAPKSMTCPKCKNGNLIHHSHYFLRGPVRIDVYRCDSCGKMESYAD